MEAAVSDTPPAGWYPDPQDNTRQRYWDGNAWTEHTAEGSPQGQAAATTGSTTSMVGDPDTWTWQSILATIFCCNFLGVAGVLNAGRAEAALRAGDLDGAREHARKARMWTLWAAGIAVVLGLLYLVFIVFVVGSAGFNEFTTEF